MSDQFASFRADELAKHPTVLELRGTEALGRPFRFDIHLRLTGVDVDADDEAAIGTAATLTLQRGGEPFEVHGILSNVTLFAQEGDWAVYRVSLVPRLWQLGLTRHSRVFTKMTVPDIFREVLEGAGLAEGKDFELRLQGDYPEEEFVAQYAESKLDFLHRWMEREGIYYFFEHNTGAEKMVLADNPSAHGKLADKDVRYQSMGLGAGGDASAQEAFDTFAVIRDAVVGAVRLSDYDYARPALDLTAEEAVSSRGFGQMTAHLGRFFDPAQARRYAKLRAEAIRPKEVTVHAAGNALHMSAGHLMTLAQHAKSKLNCDYLVTEVHHMANLLGDDDGLNRLIRPLTEDRYRVELRALQGDRPFRPKQQTRWPRVMGYETAVIDGPAESEYAQIDDQGRYLVNLRFDESDLEDGKRSTYVRMMQPHGGPNGEGFHFPLRKGTEVMMGFQEGDPDRPFIAGVVPNTAQPSVVTSNDNTWNRIATGGGNYVHLDDDEGRQHIDISTPYDRTTIGMGHPLPVNGIGEPPEDVSASFWLGTQGSAAFYLGKQWHIEVGEKKKETVKGNVEETYLADHKTTVTGVRIEQVGEAVVENYLTSQATTVSGPRSDEVTGIVSETYGALQHESGFLSVKSGPTSLEYGPTSAKFGATSVNLGPVTGKVASVSLDIPSGVIISTPNWTVTNPTQSWAGANTSVSWAKKASFTGLSFSATAVSISGTGASVARTGASNARTGISSSLVGIDMTTGGPSRQNWGIALRSAALTMIT